jgi:hypothetical protein
MEFSKAQLALVREGIDLHLSTRLYHELGKRSRAKLELALLSDFRNPVDLERWHSASFRNENSIQCSETLGCFYCQKIWTRGSKTIEEWIDCTEDEEGIEDLPQESWTALCPHCGIDSVMASADAPITPTVLEEMNRYWFGR